MSDLNITLTEFKDRLRNSSRGQLEDVLEDLFLSAQTTLKQNPNPEYRTACPLDDMLDGNYDDVYETAQDNGIAYEAKSVLTGLLNNLG